MKLDISQFGSLLTWWWLPSLGSQLLLNVCYSLQIFSPPPPSAYGLRNNHLQLARTAVILGTLLYQLYIAVTTATPNYYQLLGLPLDVDAEGVKRSFRALARRYHPDKVGEEGEAFFIVLRRAHDALSNPIRRFAYDRFGPSIVEWKDCESLRDFMRQGLTSLVAFYTINPAMYAVFGYINGSRSDGVSFWRLACLFALLAVELSMLVSPDYPTWLVVLLPNTTIHDVRQLGHALFVNFFFASIQLSAALDVIEYGQEGAPPRNQASKEASAQRQWEVIKLKAQSTNQAAQGIAKGVLQTFAKELTPFRNVGEIEGEEEEQGKMGVEEVMILERIDAVLLGRSLMQQHPQLVQLAMKETTQATRLEPQVKKEEEEIPALSQPELNPAAIKEEAAEVWLAEPSIVQANQPTVKGADPTSLEADEVGGGFQAEKEKVELTVVDTRQNAIADEKHEPANVGVLALDNARQETTSPSAETEAWVHFGSTWQPLTGQLKSKSTHESTGQPAMAPDPARIDEDASRKGEASQVKTPNRV